MIFKAVAYLFASFGVCLGTYLMLSLKKWKIGSTTVFLSLLIFLGSSLNIDKMFSANNAFNFTQQVQALSNSVQQVRTELRIQMAQTMVLTNIVNNYNDNSVRNVTEIRKEVADVREMITQLYERTRTEIALSRDKRKVTYFQKDRISVFAIKLGSYPVLNSISVMAMLENEPSITIQPLGIRVCRNVICINVKESGDNNIDTSDIEKWNITITYVVDPSRTNLVEKVEFTKDGNLIVDGNPALNERKLFGISRPISLTK